MTQVIVTRESINAMLLNPRLRIHVIGRALTGLLERQTNAEKISLATHVDNGIGFTGADARSGTLTAKSYLKNGTLEAWQVARWMKPNRLAKYHRQLNEIALQKMNTKMAA